MRNYNLQDNFTITVYTTAKELPDAWNEGLPNNHFLQSEQLSITESANFPYLSFYYVLVKKNNAIITKHYFQLLQLQKKHLINKKDAILKKIALTSFLKLTKPNLLVSGHLFRHDVCTFIKNEELSDFEAFRAYQLALQQIQKISKACAVLIKDAPLYLTPYFQNYSSGCLHLKNDVSMEMAIHKDWKNLLDYEKALKHKYAQRFRKIKKQEAPLSKRILKSEDILMYKEQLFSLYEQVSYNQPIRLGMLSPDFINIQHASKQEDLVVYGWFLEDRLIAFSSAFNFKDTWDMFYIGFDYLLNARYQLYFNILYTGVEHAIRNRKTKVIFGRTALEAKARLGCKPNYLHTFVYIDQPILKWLLKKPLASINSKEGDWEQRHPLK